MQFSDKTMKSTLPPLDLKNQEILSQFRQELDEIILNDDIERAYLFNITLQDQLRNYDQSEQTEPVLFEEYNQMVIKAKWVALTLMQRKDIKSLFKNSLAQALQMEELDLLEKLRTLLIFEPDLEKRDEFKKELINYIENNTQRIAKESINRGETRLPATVAQWLKEFKSEVGVENIRDRLKQAQFIAKNPNVLNLSPEEKRRLILLINLYDRLHRSSVTKEGIEEVIPIDDPRRAGVLRNGQFEEIRQTDTKREIDRARDIINEVNRAMKRPPKESGAGVSLSDLSRRHIAKMTTINANISDLVGKTRRDIEKIRQSFIGAIGKKDVGVAVAALYYLTGRGEFKNFLSSNQEWLERVKKFVTIKYANNKPANFIQTSPSSPPAIREFLEYILQDQLEIDENEASLIGLDIGEMIGDQYKDFAYGDPKKKSFVWAENRISDDKLVLEKPPKIEIKEEEYGIAAVPPEPFTEKFQQPEQISYDKLQKNYNNYKTQIPIFQGLENKLLEKTGGQLMRIKEELVLALKAGDKNQVVAALRILAKQVILGNILKDSTLWQKTIIEYIKNKYTAQLSQVELNQLIKNFPRLANTTSVISEFLQYLLKTRLKLSEPESALVSVDLIDILNQKGDKKYVGIITGNTETGEFEWVKNRVENGELVSEVS